MRKKIECVFTPLFALLIGMLASPATARSDDTPIERARRSMELGQEAFSQGSFQEAAALFISAYTASSFSAFLYNAGLAYEKAGDREKSVEMYRRYLEEEPAANDRPGVESRIEQLLGKAESKAEEEGPSSDPPEDGATDAAGVMKSLISVRTNPSDATIAILDESGGVISSAAAPLAQTVEKGRYTVRASHPDFRTVETEVSVSSGQVYVVVVEMSQGAFLGFLKVTSSVPGAAIYVDDRNAGKVGVTPFGSVFPTGKHTLWVELPGYAPVTEEVDIKLGESLDLEVALQRLSFGSLCVKPNTDEARVLVDGKSVGHASEKKVLSTFLMTGPHKVEVIREGMKDYAADVTIEGGKETRLRVRLSPKPSRRPAWVAASFSAVMLISGGVFGGMALSLRKDLIADRNDGRLANDDSRILQSLFWGIGADVSFGVGAILAGLSIYYFLRDPLPPSKGKVMPPKDFTENPSNVEEIDSAAAAGRADEQETAPAAAAVPETSRLGVPDRGTTWTLHPLLGTETAGFGVSIVF